MGYDCDHMEVSGKTPTYASFDLHRIGILNIIVRGNSEFN
jgi:hypothetical protein